MIQKHKTSGRVLQINTGEGKSLIIQMLAGYFCLLGKKVDILTTSPTLAKRDAQNCRRILDNLDKSVNYIPEITTEENNPYHADVLFGTVHQFCCGILKDKRNLEKTRKDRGHEILIVDEVDNMFIDCSDTRSILAQKSCFSETSKGYIQRIWEILTAMVSLSKSEENCVDYRTIGNKILEICKANLKEIKCPQTRRFMEQNIGNYIGNAISTERDLQENVHYLIKDGGVKIIDHANTGEIKISMQWGGGRHEFVSLKHNIPISEMTTGCFSMSFMDFYRLYKTEIYGLTGTVGSGPSQQFLAKHYSLDILKVPPFKQKNFVEMLPILTFSQEKWLEKIESEVEACQRHQRPCLVICESIMKANLINNFLERRFRTREYTRSDNSNVDQILGNIDSKTIILSTNLTSRGTDIEIGEQINEKGGLHVILTYLTSNSRVEEQIFGRTARKGAFGSGRLIFNSDPKTRILSDALTFGCIFMVIFRFIYFLFLPLFNETNFKI